VTLTTHPHLVSRLSMSRSYTSSHPMCLHGMQRDSFTYLWKQAASKHFKQGSKQASLQTSK
jgi:hypothetical protein